MRLAVSAGEGGGGRGSISVVAFRGPGQSPVFPSQRASGGRWAVGPVRVAPFVCLRGAPYLVVQGRGRCCGGRLPGPWTRGGGGGGPCRPADRACPASQCHAPEGLCQGVLPGLCIDLQTGEGGWHEAMVLVCLPWAPPSGLSPLHIPTLCGSERALVVWMTCPV